ncbi:MAG: putative protein of unknown function acetylesterase [Fibrobacteres bacterium]|nr:putative protein of unknown function acetylesterase [Fibrobacterota bacterium]
MNLRWVSAALPAFFMLACLDACMDTRDGKDSLQGPGTETVGLHGMAVYPDGTPAKNADVIVRSARYLPNAFPHTGRAYDQGATTTDALGRYSLDSLLPGAYAIEIRDSGNQAALVRHTLGRDRESRAAPQALLLSLAAISGRLERPEGLKVHASVGVYGLERRVFNEFETGKFMIADLPQGEYTLRVTSLDTVLGGVDVPGIQAVAKANVDIGRVLLDTLKEDYTTWARSRQVFIRTGKAGANVAGTVADFPLAIHLDSADFPFDTSSAPYGSDIRFASAAGAPLRYEIEAWDAARRVAVIWVRVDTLRGNDDGQFIRMYWGKPGAEALSYGRSVFDTALGYRNVWHLNEDPRTAGLILDATASGNDAVSPVPYATDTNTAPVYQGVYFNGRQGSLTTNQSVRPPGSLTISLWFQSFSQGKLLGFQNTPAGTAATRFDRHFWIDKNGHIRFGVNSADTAGKVLPNTRYVSYTDGYADDWEWHHVAVTMAPDSPMALYFDGAFSDRDTATRGAEDYSGYWRMGTGSLEGWLSTPVREYFYGALDEVRIEAIVRSPDWIKLSFETQKLKSTVVKIAPE